MLFLELRTDITVGVQDLLVIEKLQKNETCWTVGTTENY